MSNGKLQLVCRQLRQLSGQNANIESTDAALLQRFNRERDENAFATLVQRYGAMVLGVCRRTLQNTHDAEDAFQATFLILAQKSNTLRSSKALGCWLHEVALRTSIRARNKAIQRRRHEERATSMEKTDWIETVVWRDLQPLLDEEVGRLPKAYRNAFVLCYLEDKTYEQAAEKLGCRPGTISRRLSKARELLRARLTRRGLTLPVGIFGSVLSQFLAPSSTSAALVRCVTESVMQTMSNAGSAAASSTATALAEEGVRAMAHPKMKLSLLALVAGTALTLGLFAYHRAVAAKSDVGAAPLQFAPIEQQSQSKTQPVADVGQRSDKNKKTQTITGSVTDHASKPVADAWVAALGLSKRSGRTGAPQRVSELFGQARSSAEGRYRIAIPGTLATDYYMVFLVAWKEGHAPSYKFMELAGPARGGTLQLAKEKLIRGRLIDIQGLPAAGVAVQVIQMELSDGHRSPPLPVGKDRTQLRAWPPPVKTDKNGLFTIHSVVQGAMAELEIGGNGRFARQHLTVNPTKHNKKLIQSSMRAGRPMPFVEADWKAAGSHFTWAIAPAQVIDGTVLYEDTGKPVANARVVVYSGQGIHTGVDEDSNEVQTDANGFYRIFPKYGDHLSVTVVPPVGAPYLLQRKSFIWKQAAKHTKSLSFKLLRAVMMQGTVTEETTGKPIPNASVEYFAHKTDNPFFKFGSIGSSERLKQIGTTDAKGAFQIPIIPGKGFLLINTSDPNYIRNEVDSKKLATYRYYARQFYPQGFAKLDIKPEAKTATEHVKLRRGATLHGRLFDSDGEPVLKAHVLFRHRIPYGYEWHPGEFLRIEDGTFTVAGLDMAKKNDIYFLNADRQLGGMLTVTKEHLAENKFRLVLAPCGSAKVRLVDGKGERKKEMTVGAILVITPGSSLAETDMAMMRSLDRKRYSSLRPDEQGYITLPTLIPGATYRLYGRQANTQFEVRLYTIERDFTVGTGKTVDLGDVKVKSDR